MHFYLLHGLRVSASRAIPALPQIEPARAPDLTVWFGGDPPIPEDHFGSAHAETWFRSAYQSEAGTPVLKAVRTCDGRYYRITYAEGSSFVIDRSGRQIWVTWPPTQTELDACAFLLGPVIGAVLRIRGALCLHASAVAIDDQAAVFAGPVGAGKSTTAAAFAAHGFPVLSDDTVVVTREGGSWNATPGYPRLRLWPESASAVAGWVSSRALLPPGTNGSSRRFHLDLVVEGLRFQHAPLPVGAIYLLDDTRANSCGSEDVRPARALMELVGQTYAPRVIDRSQRAQEFDDLSQLVQSVPVRSLTRPDDLDRLSEFCDFIVDDFRCLHASAAAR